MLIIPKLWSYTLCNYCSLETSPKHETLSQSKELRLVINKKRQLEFSRSAEYENDITMRNDVN